MSDDLPKLPNGVPWPPGALQDVSQHIPNPEVVWLRHLGVRREATQERESLVEPLKVREGGTRDDGRLRTNLFRKAAPENRPSRLDRLLGAPDGPLAVGDQVILIQPAGEPAVRLELAQGVAKPLQTVERDSENLPGGGSPRRSALRLLPRSNRVIEAILPERFHRSADEREGAIRPSRASGCLELLGNASRQVDCLSFRLSCSGHAGRA